MKIIAYLFSKLDDHQQQLVDLHKQKMAVFEYCKNNNNELIECITEITNKNNENFSTLFNIISKNHSFDKIIFFDKNIFQDNPEFNDWIFNELKSKNIKFDFVQKTPEDDIKESIDVKKELLIQKARNVPTLPDTVIKTLKLIQNEKSSAWQLAKTIKYDTGLAGKILKLVNSTFYGFPKEISSIQHGIAILGFNTIKGLIISSNIYKYYQKSDNDLFNYKDFWMHTTLCAKIANEFSQKFNYLDEHKEELFSSAILHDIGKLILNQYDYENYKNVLQNRHISIDDKFNTKLEEKFCTLNHAVVGEIVTGSWNLPEIISQTAAFHHSPFNAKEEYQKTICIINIANTMSNIILCGIEPKEDFFEKDILDAAQIKYDTIVDKVKSFEDNPDKINELKHFFE